MQDLRLAARALQGTPLVTTVAVLSLALGIGANTAIFSLANSLLLRSLPVAEPQRLVTVSSDFALSHGYRNGIGWSYAAWERLRQRADAFDGAYVWTWASFDLASRGEREPARGMIASGDFFRTVGVRPFLGRTFSTSDDVRGGGPDGPVAVISYNFWQRRFRGDPAVVGTRLSLDRVPFTIVGVTSPEFFGIEVGEVFDVVVPLGTDTLLKGSGSLLDKQNMLMLTPMLRLKADQSLEVATETLRALQPEILDIGRSNVPGFMKEAFVLVPAATGSTDKTLLRQQYESPLVAVGAVVGLVLLIACANIANLLLARADARRHELSVRTALGATRWRLARQWLVESLLLAGAGAAVGLLFAVWASRLIVAQLSISGAAVVLDQSLDWRVLGFTTAVAAMTAVLAGAVPAFRASRAAPIDAIKEQTRGAGHRRAGLSGGLIVVQVALSLVLVVAAGLFLATFQRLGRAPLGFDGDRVLVATVETASAAIGPDSGPAERVRRSPADLQALYDRLVTAVTAEPGVAAAAASLYTPGGNGGAGLGMIDARGKAVGDTRRAVMNAVTSGWFSTFGIALRAGRDFSDADTATSPRVVIVNDTYARVFFPGQSVIGATFDDGTGASATSAVAGRTIIGVVADVVYGSARNAVLPTAYVPLEQSAGIGSPARTSIQIGVRAARELSPEFSRNVSAAFSAVDQDLTFTFRVVGDSVRASVARERLLALLSGFFGALAVLLAGLGLYGLTSYAVSRRRAEFGVRIALGARPGSILTLVFSQAFKLVIAGLIAGAAASLWAMKFTAALLFGLEPRDPFVLTTAIAVLAAVAVLASWIPARRAVRINPADLLREN